MLKILISLGLVLFLLHSFQLLGFTARRYDTWTWTSCPSSSSASEQTCPISHATLAQDIQIVVKTGGSEPQNRLRSQLATVPSQIPQRDILIFSDLEEEEGGYSVQDVCADLSVQERAEYPEFEPYDVQQEYKRLGKNTRDLRGGWDLAK